MSPSLLFLTGAPEPSLLQWDSESLLDTFTGPIARFAGVSKASYKSASPSLTSSNSRQASWRSLDLARQHLATGHSQGHGWADEYQGNASFLTTSDLSFSSAGSDDHKSQQHHDQETTQESVREGLSHFYEHSFAVHANIASSQIQASPSEHHRIIPSASDGRPDQTHVDSFATTTSDLSYENQGGEPSPLRLSIPIGGHLSDLEDIPDAAYLSSIQPQTMTVNLIVGIISISAPRGIKTRRGVDVDIVEILVGDETKSGFGINCWLPSTVHVNDEGSAEHNLRGILGGLRPQDIVLLRNVALSSFRGKVYGQSLRKGMTTAHLLFRNRIDRHDAGGCYTVEDLEAQQQVHPQIAKTKRVREWVLRFVGVAQTGTRKAGRGRVEIMKEVLPPDTQ